MELGAEEGVLFFQVCMEGVDVCELIREGLCGGGMLYQRVRDGFWVRRRGVEYYSCRGECIQSFLTRLCEVCFNVS